MTQYLFGVCHEDNYEDQDLSTPENQAMFARVSAINEEMQAKGIMVMAMGLHSASTATVVHATESGVTMTDGPFAETKEQMGGFWIIEVPDLDVALEWAARCSAACGVPIEVRASHDHEIEAQL